MTMFQFLMTKQVKPLYISASLILVIVVPLYLSLGSTAPAPKQTSSSVSEEKPTPMATNAFGVKVEKNPTQSQLTELGVTTWPKWECGPSKFPWSFTATETMYLLKGKVNVEVDGFEGSFEIGAGDLVVFPKGMKVTWDVIEGVHKHYSLEKYEEGSLGCNFPVSYDVKACKSPKEELPVVGGVVIDVSTCFEAAKQFLIQLMRKLSVMKS